MYVLLMNIIGFFSKSEWIDLASGILLLVTFKSQKDQFKEQNKSTEKQFQEQNRLAVERLKEQMEQQNKAAKEQLDAQNELALKKDKRMLATQIRISKLEECHKDLIAYITLAKSACIIILNFNNHSLEYPEYYKELTEFNSKASHIDSKMSDFCYFFPDFKEDVALLKISYNSLAKSIPHTFIEIKEPEKFKDTIIDNKLSFRYATDDMAKKLSITKLSILKDLEITL